MAEAIEKPAQKSRVNSELLSNANWYSFCIAVSVQSFFEKVNNFKN